MFVLSIPDPRTVHLVNHLNGDTAKIDRSWKRQPVLTSMCFGRLRWRSAPSASSDKGFALPLDHFLLFPRGAFTNVPLTTDQYYVGGNRSRRTKEVMRTHTSCRMTLSLPGSLSLPQTPPSLNAVKRLHPRPSPLPACRFPQHPLHRSHHPYVAPLQPPRSSCFRRCDPPPPSRRPVSSSLVLS